MLKKAPKIIPAGLMLVLLAQPLAACLASGRSMTEEEHNCCLKMASMCDTSAMPASHSCCKHAVSPQAVAVSKVRNGDLAASALFLCEVDRGCLVPMLGSIGRGSESPPESPPQINNVLRI
jgi:hypothetical protein